jgi:hypothetical protein
MADQNNQEHVWGSMHNASSFVNKINTIIYDKQQVQNWKKQIKNNSSPLSLGGN